MDCHRGGVDSSNFDSSLMLPMTDIVTTNKVLAEVRNTVSLAFCICSISFELETCNLSLLLLRLVSVRCPSTYNLSLKVVL